MMRIKISYKKNRQLFNNLRDYKSEACKLNGIQTADRGFMVMLQHLNRVVDQAFSVCVQRQIKKSELEL